MVYLWDAVTGEFKRTLYGHKGAVNSVAFNPMSGVLASGSSDGRCCCGKSLIKSSYSRATTSFLIPICRGVAPTGIDEM